MEWRTELLLGHPLIQAELKTRSLLKMKELLGEQRKENHKAYENNWLQINELWRTKNKFFVPHGMYTFSDTRKLKESRVEESQLLAECIVVFALPQYEGVDTLEQYLMHLLQISVMDAVRDYIREVMVPQLCRHMGGTVSGQVSEFYGPGLFMEPLHTMQEMLTVTRVKTVHMAEGRLLLEPDMAFAGVLYVTKEPVILSVTACQSCKAKIGCEYCMKHEGR